MSAHPSPRRVTLRVKLTRRAGDPSASRVALELVDDFPVSAEDLRAGVSHQLDRHRVRHTAGHLGQCEFVGETDAAMLRVLLKVTDKGDTTGSNAAPARWAGTFRTTPRASGDDTSSSAAAKRRSESHDGPSPCPHPDHPPPIGARPWLRPRRAASDRRARSPRGLRRPSRWFRRRCRRRRCRSPPSTLSGFRRGTRFPGDWRHSCLW
jgi:hypothetical protein